MCVYVLLFDSCLSHTKPLNMQGICQHSRQTTAHQAWWSPYTDTDCQTTPLLIHNPPLLVLSVCVWESHQSVEATVWRVCVSVVDAPSAPKTPMTHLFGSLLQPPQWHRYDIIATPDPQPDLIPASQGGRGRGRGESAKKSDSRRKGSAQYFACTTTYGGNKFWDLVKAEDETAQQV